MACACDDGFYLCGLEQASCVVTDSGIAAASICMLEPAGILVGVVDAKTVPRGPLAGGCRSALDALAALRETTRH